MFFQVVLLTLLALLPMVNPPTTATLLLGLSKGMSREHVRRQVNLAAIYLFCTLCITFFIGSSILDLFGISIPGLRLAGGLIIGFIGFRMLFPAPSQQSGVDINQSIAFVPLTMPSMCGPGTMALVISGAAQIAELPDEYNRLTIYAGVLCTAPPPWNTGSCATSLMPLMQNCIPMQTSRKPMMRVMASMPVAPKILQTGSASFNTPQLIRLIRANAVTTPT